MSESTAEERPAFQVPDDLPPEKLNELAREFYAGRIYTDRHLRDPSMVSSVFMPLALGALAGVTEEQAGQIGLIYEYLSKAGPLSVNGCPMFFSCRFLNNADAARLFEAVKKIQAAVDGVAPTAGV